ncbi:MAG: hypothetical protein H6Q84_580 [Deltaproteobacteria bacterium]|nr:hypothetical protein [Deltaproteobacteria bacterium]
MVFLLSESAGEVRWLEWRKMGGCSLSLQAENPIRKYYHGKRQRFEIQNPTLKEIGKISRLAEREIARYAHEYLKLENFVIPEPPG